MKKYSFLFKPILFIVSLIFATWLTLYIERLEPSDFGKYEYIFSSKPEPVHKTPDVKKIPEDKKLQSVSLKSRQECMKKICIDYKAGLIDSTELDQELEKLLKSFREVSPK